MLNVILMVLKVIGITLASLVGILLLLTVLVLWVPVRYRILAAKQEDIYAKVKISWLFRFVYVLIRYEDSKVLYIIRIIGIPIYDSRKPKKEKLKKEKKTRVKKIKTKKKKVNSVKTNHHNKIEIKQIKPKDEIQPADRTKATKEVKSTVASKITDDIKTINSSEVIELEEQEESAKDLHSVRKGMKYRIKQIISIIYSIPNKIRNLIVVLKEKINKALLLIKKVSAYPKKFKDLLVDEENKAGLKILIQTVKDLLKRLKPKKVEGELVFGLDDPCSTGQVLGVISIVYAYIAPKSFQVIPDFQETRLEGRIDARGRIFTFSVLRIVIRLLRNKHFKTLKEAIIKFKEE